MECVTGVWGALHARGQSNRTPVACLKSSKNYGIPTSRSVARALRTKRRRTHSSVCAPADTCDSRRRSNFQMRHFCNSLFPMPTLERQYTGLSEDFVSDSIIQDLEFKEQSQPVEIETVPLRIVIVGHVDHGKSTLVGRLLYETGSLPEGKFENIQAVSQRRGMPFEWAFLMDALQAERDQNITIDVSQIWFRSEKRPYVIIDAPGHKEFLKNMVTGAASADAALLLIAANEGVQEQSKRHAYLLSMLGVDQVIVLINKMDLVDYSKSVYYRIEADYRDFLAKLGIRPLKFIPIAAREGLNLIKPIVGVADWYSGQTILQALDDLASPGSEKDGPLRFAVQDVYRFDDRRIVAGRVESGTIKVGDYIIFSPNNKSANVASIEKWNSPHRDQALAGESIGITLSEQIFVERGHIGSLETLA